MPIIPKVLAVFAICCLIMVPRVGSPAQEKGRSPSPSSCTRDRALDLIRQQIDATKTFDNAVQRISVMIRAADLLWPYQPNKARAVFKESLELAQQNYKETGDKDRKEGAFAVAQVPDQRYTVINAIAKRDLAWARELTEQLLKEEQQQAEDKTARDVRDDAKTNEKLLAIALTQLPSDQTAALNFAVRSLRYPATLYLPLFLYQLAPINRAAADQFYQEALSAYADAPMERVLYLSSYPFANDREVGDMPGYTVYRIPEGFTPNPALQRLFVGNLLRRVQQFIENPSEAATTRRLSEPGQMWLALTRLEKQIQQSLPDLAPAAEQAKSSIYVRLNQNDQREVGRTVNGDNEPKTTFDEKVEAAEKSPNVDNRDRLLTSAITGSSTKESLEHVLSVVDKISDSNVRSQLLNWFYFNRTEVAIKDKKLDEARKLAAKVDELDQRAYLYLRVAEESLKQDMDQTQAREMLDEVADASAKAPATMVTARALLGIAYLYSKFDMNRAMVVLGDAVKLINRLEAPDFSRQYVTRKIEGKTFGSYTSFQTPGFNPESALRELGKLNFDSALNQSSNFADKSLRAMTTLALAEQCLKEQTAKPKPKETKLPASKP
ncbi:MAG: hypothetical protein QOG23_3311 [Blastocatellia bacterium]|nr:hypothetical protein [Blastocatellia bacterium]